MLLCCSRPSSCQPCPGWLQPLGVEDGDGDGGGRRDGDRDGVRGAPEPHGLAGSQEVAQPLAFQVCLSGFHLLVSTAAALQGKPPNAANTMLPDSVMAFVGSFPARRMVRRRERVKQ